jgi:hypothetical protein
VLKPIDAIPRPATVCVPLKRSELFSDIQNVAEPQSSEWPLSSPTKRRSDGGKLPSVCATTPDGGLTLTKVGQTTRNPFTYNITGRPKSVNSATFPIPLPKHQYFGALQSHTKARKLSWGSGYHSPRRRTRPQLLRISEA